MANGIRVMHRVAFAFGLMSEWQLANIALMCAWGFTFNAAVALGDKNCEETSAKANSQHYQIKALPLISLTAIHHDTAHKQAG